MACLHTSLFRRLLLAAAFALLLSAPALAEEEFIAASLGADEIDEGQEFSLDEVLTDQQLQYPDGERNTYYYAEAQSRKRWRWQLMPSSILYTSYLADAHEPRFAIYWNDEKDFGRIWDVTLGGRVGILRYGNTSNLNPEGWQLDMEGAAFPRLQADNDLDLVSADFRFGIPLTYRRGKWAFKAGYYHLSSHVGDEWWENNPMFTRINFSRDVAIFGTSYYRTPDLRLYGEVGFAFRTDGGTKVSEAQFGIDYSPRRYNGILGTPFWAVNAHLREELDFGGNFVGQIGWQWRGTCNNHLFRAGFEYYNGGSRQFEFYTENEEQVGFGLWYDY